MKVWIAFDGDEVLGVFDDIEKARNCLTENGFTHYPQGHPDAEKLALWGAKWLRKRKLVNGQTEWIRGYAASYEVE